MAACAQDAEGLYTCTCRLEEAVYVITHIRADADSAVDAANSSDSRSDTGVVAELLPLLVTALSRRGRFDLLTGAVEDVMRTCVWRVWRVTRG